MQLALELVPGWRSFEKANTATNRTFKGDADGSSEKKRSAGKTSVFLENPSNPEQNVSRNRQQRPFFEVSVGNEKHVVGERRKFPSLLQNVTKNVAELCSCPSVLQRASLRSHEIGYLAEEIPKQSVAGVAFFSSLLM